MYLPLLLGGILLQAAVFTSAAPVKGRLDPSSELPGQWYHSLEHSSSSLETLANAERLRQERLEVTGTSSSLRRTQGSGQKASSSGRLEEGDFGIMAVNQPISERRSRLSPFQIGLPYESDVHIIDKVEHNPANLDLLLRTIPVRYKEDDYGLTPQERQDMIKSLQSLTFMNQDGGDHPTRPPAVHAVYASTANKDILFYSNVGLKDVAKEQKDEQRRRDAIGRPILTDRSKKKLLKEFNKAYLHRLSILHPSQRHSLEKLLKIDFDLGTGLLGREAMQFRNLMNAHKRGELPRLHYNQCTGFRRTKSRVNQQRTRLFTEAQIQAEPCQQREDRMVESNYAKMEDSITKTFDYPSSSDDETQELLPQFKHEPRMQSDYFKFGNPAGIDSASSSQHSDGMNEMNDNSASPSLVSSDKEVENTLWQDHNLDTSSSRSSNPSHMPSASYDACSDSDTDDATRQSPQSSSSHPHKGKGIRSFFGGLRRKLSFGSKYH